MSTSTGSSNLRAEVEAPEITEDEMVRALQEHADRLEQGKQQVTEMGTMTEYEVDRRILVMRTAAAELRLWFEAKAKIGERYDQVGRVSPDA